MKQHVTIYTERLRDDSSGARLAERVEEYLSDHPGAVIQWRQTHGWFGSVRLTAIMLWRGR